MEQQLAPQRQAAGERARITAVRRGAIRDKVHIGRVENSFREAVSIFLKGAVPKSSRIRQADQGAPAAEIAGTLDWALAYLSLPKVPDKYFSAGEVDIRAEPMIDLIPPGVERSETTAGPGRLKLRLLIDELGKVTSIEVLASYPPGFLEDSALPYIREILFAPARLNSMAVKSEKIIEIAYSPDADP